MAEYSGIALKISQPFENVRLLEVPEDLLSIITSSNLNGQPLFLKSSPTTGNPSSNQEGNLHLCTNDKAWLVKQVSTSNSIYLTRSEGVDVNSTDTQNEGTTGNIITAYAKPSSILELHSIKEADSNAVAETHLRQLLPVLTSSTQIIQQSQFSKQQLYSEIPAPRNSILQALGQNCVIELPWSMPAGPYTRGNRHDVKAYIPEPSLLLETWRGIVEVATISELNIMGNLEADILLEAFTEAEDAASQSQNILKATARAMFERDGYFESIGIITRGLRWDVQDNMNEMDLARWVGNMLLKEAQVKTNTTIQREQFESQWEDAVPAYLAKYCSAEVLGQSCTVQNDGPTDSIDWRDFKIASKEGTEGDTVSRTTASTNKAKRKWHDKFAATRSAKR